MIKGFFFDLDGTIVDTHQANYEAYRRALADNGIMIDFENFKQTIGRQAKDFLPELAPSLDPSSYEQIAERKAIYYEELAPLSRLNVSLKQFIDYMKKDHIVALVTTAKLKNATVILKHHNLINDFDFIVSAEDVHSSKPSPEAYLLALEKSCLQANEVVVFEDSEAGLKAAERAGIAVVRVRDFYEST